MMNDKPLMKCGHVANGTYGDEHKPICVICYGIVPGATEINDTQPDLIGRKAKCPFCNTIVDSNYNLPFYYNKPECEYDEYYCGCIGLD